METQNANCYIGLDLSDHYAMVSFLKKGMAEPETVSTIAGSEIYQIPVAIGRKKTMGQWVYGEEARHMEKLGNGICITNLMERARRREQIVIEGQEYEAEELFALYLRKILALPGRLGTGMQIEKLVITLEKPGKELARMFANVLDKIGIRQDQFHVQDYKESFYYYTLNQKKELWVHDVALFHYAEGEMKFWCLSKDAKTSPKIVSVVEQNLGNLGEERDLRFAKQVEQCFYKKIVTTAYLIGEGFEGNWMHQSLRVLCKNRKVFLGKNLYSVGACFGARNKAMAEKWPYVYMGASEMKVNVGLKVENMHQTQYYSLITAGENWYETHGSCEVILSGEPEVDCYLQMPKSRRAKLQKLKLTGMPERPDRVTRIRITAEPVSDNSVNVEIKDLGFGELFKGSDRTWNYTLEA